MDGRELRRSYTQLEFPVSSRIVRPQHHQHYQQVRPLGKRYQQMATTATRSKFPTMEFYRPPNVRDTKNAIESSINTSGAKLNVHAKEFVMSAPLQPSKSTGSILSAVEDSKQNSKPILHSTHKSSQLQHGHHQQQSRAVQWIDEKIWAENKINSNIQNSTGNSMVGRDLKRSKSTGSSIHSIAITAVSPNSMPLPHELALFDNHPADSIIKKACYNTGPLTCEEMVELPRLILEKALDDRAHAQSYANITMCIIERESTGTFLESLLNICQYTCEKKKTQKSGGDQTSKYHSFMAYLNELYSHMKPKQSHLKLMTGTNPRHTILSLLVQVCQGILAQKTLNSRPEIECLFFTVTTVGMDLELEDPKLLESLMWAVRDAFLAPGTSQPNKHTLLQLIELKAARWQLPAATIMYYKDNAHL